MENPWHSLSTTPPFVLDSDLRIVEEFNKRKGVEHQHAVRFGPFPEPFLGRPDAPLILLNGNPGANPDLDPVSAPFYELDHPMMVAARRNLLHETLDYPFSTLDPAFSGFPGYQWWTKKLGPLIRYCGSDGQRMVANQTLCVEYFPYHSKNFARFPLLESQKYSFELVRRAVAQSATIIIMRCRALWLTAVPEVSHYGRAFGLKNVQNVSISPGNMSATAWDACCTSVCPRRNLAAT
jgi:hypothetical protein